MDSDFEVNQTNIKGGCESGRKVVPHDSKSDLPLVSILYLSRLATRILSKIAEMFFNLIAEKLAKPTCVHFYQVHYVLANLPFLYSQL